ncbi:MAG: phosphate acetyltransferase, partial [Candidatus Omnitrophica bacterium]|nr:phosphate acetyltransferase [Candidatus Omnitrophota bacterium]
MSIINEIRLRAAKNPRKIVLPESDDPRTMTALEYILDKKIAKIILIGKEELRANVKSKNMQDLEIIDPLKYEHTAAIVNEYYELRKTKGMTLEEADRTVKEDW